MRKKMITFWDSFQQPAATLSWIDLEMFSQWTKLAWLVIKFSFIYWLIYFLTVTYNVQFLTFSQNSYEDRQIDSTRTFGYFLFLNNQVFHLSILSGIPLKNWQGSLLPRICASNHWKGLKLSNEAALSSSLWERNYIP